MPAPLQTGSLILPDFSETIEFAYDRSSRRKFLKSVLLFSVFIVVGIGLMLHALQEPGAFDRRAFGIGLLAILLFGGVVIFQLSNIHHFNDRFRFDTLEARVSNPRKGEIAIPWSRVEEIRLNQMQDEIHILGDNKKILIDESLPDFNLYLELFGLRKATAGGPIRRTRPAPSTRL
jgi:hypothetical protein